MFFAYPFNLSFFICHIDFQVRNFIKSAIDRGSLNKYPIILIAQSQVLIMHLIKILIEIRPLLNTAVNTLEKCQGESTAKNSIKS
jgi:hypothetical protein